MEDKSNKALNNSLNKALGLLDHFTAERDSIGLSELSKLSGIPKATVYRLASTLEDNGFLQKADVMGKENQYRLGLKLLELGRLVSEKLELRKTALPYMEELRDKVNECVQLIIRDHDEAIYIEKLESSRPVRVYTRVGRRAPLYGGACPRAILSFLKDEEIEQILASKAMVSVTKNTITDKELLFKSIRETREKGYTISYGELEPETGAVGAPIFDFSGKVIGSISIAGPESRFSENELPFLIDELLKTTGKISKVFGYKKPQTV